MPGLRSAKKRLRRERILGAAIRAFNTRGFSATTMQEIAGEADLAVGTLYNYFPSKNELLLGILETEMEEIRHIDPRLIVRLFRSNDEGSAILEKIVEEVLRKTFVLTRQNWYETLSALFASPPDVQRGVAMDLEAIGMLQNILRHMRRRGLVRADTSVEAMAVLLYSLVAFQFMGYVFMPEVAEQQLMDGVSQQIRLAFLGIGPGRDRPGRDGTTKAKEPTEEPNG